MRICAFSLLGVLVLAMGGIVHGTDTPPLQPAPAACCPEHCPRCGKPYCVPAPAKKKIEKVVYACKAVDFCVPKCPGCRIVHEKDCNGCEIPLTPNCGRVHTARVLIKKVQTKECDTCQCVPPCGVPR